MFKLLWWSRRSYAYSSQKNKRPPNSECFGFSLVSIFAAKRLNYFISRRYPDPKVVDTDHDINLYVDKMYIVIETHS